MKTIETKPVKKAYPTIVPYLMVEGAAKLMDFLKHAFNAEEVQCQLMPDGAVTHAEMRIGDSMVMVSDAKAEYPAMPTMIFMYLDDCDKYYEQALEAGATSIREPNNEEYGDRMSGVRDFAGNQWWIASAINK